MQPVSVGSAVKYTRFVPETKDAPAHHETLDALLIRYDVESDPDKVPNAHLVFVDSKGHRHLRDSNFLDAFQDVGGVPYEPEGEFYHGWTEFDDSHDSLLRQLVDADTKIEDLEGRIRELQATNTILNENIAQLTAKAAELTGVVPQPFNDDHLVSEPASTVVNTPPAEPEAKPSKVRVIKGK